MSIKQSAGSDLSRDTSAAGTFCPRPTVGLWTIVSSQRDQQGETAATLLIDTPPHTSQHPIFCSSDGRRASSGCGDLWISRSAGPPNGLGHGGVPPEPAGPQRPGPRQEPLPPLPRDPLQNAARHLRRDRRGRGGGLIAAGGRASTPLLPAVPGEPAAEHTLPTLPPGDLPQQHPSSSGTGQPGLQRL